MKKASIVVAAAACCIIATYDSDAGDAAAHTLVEIDCPAHEIPGEVYCRAILVAENPDMPEGREVPVRIMVLAATGDSPKVDPLVIIPGGPGQSAIEEPNLRNFFSVYFAAIRTHRDVILVDQRGVGGSNPLPLDPPADLLYVRTEMNMPPEWGRAALQSLRNKADLAQYTTARAVDDLDAVRRAILADELNIYATSYGTRVAQYYIKRYGEHVRTVILKAVSPPAENIALSYGRKPQRALEMLFEMCASDAGCAAAYPDLRGQLESVLERLEHAPVVLDVQHPVTGEPLPFRITRGNFAFGIRTQMMNAYSFARLPKLIVEAKRGNFSAWAQFLSQVPTLYATKLYGGMAFSVIATEDVARLTESMIRADAEGTLIGDAIARGLSELDEFWPTGEAPDSLFIPLRSSIPILLVSGALDPATPPEGAEAMLPGLPNGRHIVFRGGAHSAANFDGLDKIMAEFISAGTAEALDLSAVENNRPLPFDNGGESD